MAHNAKGSNAVMHFVEARPLELRKPRRNDATPPG
jgi:hypothetical protein